MLGAVNTIIAGLLALLHNSGLPDRYRYDMTEFEQLEDHIRELLDTGLAPADRAIDQILAECFDLYTEAKLTVQANMPVTYNSRNALQKVRQSAIMLPSGPQPAADREALPRMTLGGEKTPSPTVTVSPVPVNAGPSTATK